MNTDFHRYEIATDLCQSVSICGLLSVLHEGEIELLLMYARIAADVNTAEIVFDFVQHVAFSAAQGPGNFRIDS